jgi:hypothetical protein
MHLPTKKPTKPADIAGMKNGELPESALAPCGIGAFRMEKTAALAMNALVKDAAAAGFEIKATGTYRSIAAQTALFHSRYTREPIQGAPTKTWKGETWYQKPGTAMAATPGTSNHGWGLAADLAEERDGDPQPESVSTALVAWLVQHAATYGFAAEAQSEPWHWVYTEGDKLPAAVTGETSQAPTQELPARKTLRRGDTGPDVKRCQNLLVENGIKVRGGADGIFGKHTEAAVRSFQRAHSLQPDGVVGPKTWSELER